MELIKSCSKSNSLLTKKNRHESECWVLYQNVLCQNIHSLDNVKYIFSTWNDNFHIQESYVATFIYKKFESGVPCWSPLPHLDIKNASEVGRDRIHLVNKSKCNIITLMVTCWNIIEMPFIYFSTILYSYLHYVT
jgi:hypothetical protein